MDAEIVQILLVEDNDDDVLMIQQSFKKQQLVNIFHVAKNGEDAMRFMKKEGEHANAARPGLVLLDINMPIKNGFEVLEEMKADPDLARIPVIMLTTSDREEDIARSYSSGACSFVSKPLDFEAFKDVANRFALYWALVSKLPKNGAA